MPNTAKQRMLDHVEKSRELLTRSPYSALARIEDASTYEESLSRALSQAMPTRPGTCSFLMQAVRETIQNLPLEARLLEIAVGIREASEVIAAYSRQAANPISGAKSMQSKAMTPNVDPCIVAVIWA